MIRIVPTQCAQQKIFALIRERMDILDGENEDRADFLDPVAMPELPEVSVDDKEGGTNVVIPQEDNVSTTGNDNGDRAGELTPTVPTPSHGVQTPRGNALQTPRGNARSPSNQEFGMGAGERPSIEGMRVRTPRRNVPSPSSQSINFPQQMQYMMMRSDEENCIE